MNTPLRSSVGASRGRPDASREDPFTTPHAAPGPSAPPPLTRGKSTSSVDSSRSVGSSARRDLMSELNEAYDPDVLARAGPKTTGAVDVLVRKTPKMGDQLWISVAPVQSILTALGVDDIPRSWTVKGSASYVVPGASSILHLEARCFLGVVRGEAGFNDEGVIVYFCCKGRGPTLTVERSPPDARWLWVAYVSTSSGEELDRATALVSV